MSKIPSSYATMDIAWGAGKKHLYSPDDKSLKFHNDEVEARAHADAEIQNGSKMVGLFKIQTLLVAKSIEYDQVDI